MICDGLLLHFGFTFVKTSMFFALLFRAWNLHRCVINFGIDLDMRPKTSSNSMTLAMDFNSFTLQKTRMFENFPDFVRYQCLHGLLMRSGIDIASILVACWHNFSYGPTVGALNAESPKRTFPKLQKVIWSRNRCFSYGFLPYFACAKL